MLFKILNRISTSANLHALLLHQQILSTPRYEDPRRISNYEHRVYSQNGEDGILQYLCSLLGLGADSEFLEIGCGDGLENNTRALLDIGWKGTWVEGSPRNFARIRKRFSSVVSGGRLSLIQAIASPENINQLLKRQGIQGVNVLSLDIDLDTHHVWRALDSLFPEIVVIEYNASWRPPILFETPFVKGEWWDGESRKFGASLQTLAQIGKKKGYSLVGCDLCGVNGFFVRNDLVTDERFLSPFDAITHYEPPRYNISPPGTPRWR